MLENYLLQYFKIAVCEYYLYIKLIKDKHNQWKNQVTFCPTQGFRHGQVRILVRTYALPVDRFNNSYVFVCDCISFLTQIINIY